MEEYVWQDAYERIANKMAKYLELREPSAREDMTEQLRRTFLYAEEAAEGKVRKNGDTLLTHILQSAELLLLIKPDLATMQVCLLHETIKACGKEKEDLIPVVGEEVAELVVRFTNLKKVRLHAHTKEEIMQLRQMLLALADDVRVILVKLSTRLAGLMTLEAMPREKQLRIAKEMLEVYAPIAGRLGVYALKVRIEDEAFRVMHPKVYAKTEYELEVLQKKNADILEVGKKQLSLLMQEHKISGKIYGRIKSVYSTAHKMQQKHTLHAAELYDIFALRVVVQSKEDCYKLLGYIHERYPPITERLKDYIASPKANNYQSLHTSVIEMYPDNPLRPVEVQIRTRSMDDVAEYGVASHGGYKEHGSIPDHGDLWQEKLARINKEFKRRGRILGSDSGDLSQFIHKIFAVTPKGDILTLQQGATPLDFAYAIHTDVGHRCIGATVNGRGVPLSYTLRTGDTVQVTTRENHRPSGTSLLYARTTSARAKINAYLKEEQRETFVERGRDLINAALTDVNKPPLDASMTILEPLLEQGKFRSKEKERLLLHVGKGVTSPLSVVRKLYPDVLRIQVARKRRTSTAVDTRIWMVGEDPDIPYALAKCCLSRLVQQDPKELIAYISTGHLIRIHRKDCAHIVGKPHERFLSVTLKPCKEGKNP